MSRLGREVLIVIAAVLLLFLFIMVMTEVASAQAVGPQCGPHDAVTQSLNGRYGETRHGMGVAANSAVMELWVSEANRTWTMTVTMPSGLTCMVASGDGFEAVSEALPPPGDDL